jgi:alpha-tubulin suppressor-like RCC1 family protein
MKERAWIIMLACALVVTGALFFGCNQPTDDPLAPGPQTQDDDQDDDDDGPVFPEITGFPISSSGASTAVTLLLKSDGTVWATGYNRYGGFGNGTTINIPGGGLYDPPIYTADTFTQVADHVVAVADSSEDTYLIKDDGSLWAAGRNTNKAHTTNTSTFEKELDSGVKAVSVNGGILVLMENGDVYARGKNGNGQLGTGTTTDVTTWTNVASDVTAIAKSEHFSLILKNDGEVWGAGINHQGALGLAEDNTQHSTFQKVFEGAAAIAVGPSSHSLILKNDGSVWGTGQAYFGRLGNGNTGAAAVNPDITAFTQIKDSEGTVISGVSAISAGAYHSLILKTDGSVWGTGRLNFDFNDGQNGADVGRFTRMAEGVTKISAQGYQSFIIKGDGTLWVAGNVNVGIFGNIAQEKKLAFTQVPLSE